jgi:adenosylcobinamide-GDP ribazoletransferase
VVRLNNLAAAVSFLTRIPVRLREEPSMTAAVPWFPVVGAGIGVIVGGVAVGLAELVPMSVAAAVAVLVGVLVTGAFHEDGLADVADAFAGGWTVEQRLRILKDPLHGSYGVAALCGTIVLRIVALASLGPAVAFAGAVAAHTLARGAAVGLMGTVRVATADGLGADYARSLPRRSAVVGVAVSIAIAAVATGWWVGPLAVAAVLAAITVGWLAVRKIGGITGDVLGATEQVAECLVLVTITALAARHALYWQ